VDRSARDVCGTDAHGNPVPCPLQPNPAGEHCGTDATGAPVPCPPVVEPTPTVERPAFVAWHRAPTPVPFADPTGNTGLHGYADAATVLDTVQFGLDGAGMLPGVGIIPDGINVCISVGRGEWGAAGLSAGAMIPILGTLAPGAKYSDEALDALAIMRWEEEGGAFLDEAVDAAGDAARGADALGWGAGSSDVLRQNLRAAGLQPPPFPNAAHHIVAHTDPRAALAQEYLKSFGIHADDAVNGVFLRYGDEVSKVGANHRNIHTDTYYQEVNRRVLEGSTREEVMLILRDIADELRLDTFSY